MTYDINLTMKIEEPEEEIRIICSIDDDERKLLDDFIQYAEDLLRTDWVKNGMQSKLDLQWKIGEPILVKAELPIWDDVIVFLHKIRPLLLQNEVTNFKRVASFLYKTIENSHIRSFIAEQRRIYSGQMIQDIFKISSNDVIINSEKVLIDWLNAYEYHRDQEKKKSIDELHHMIPLDASKVLFLQMLSDKVAAIYAFTGFIRLLLGKQSDFFLRAKLNNT